MIQPTSRPKRDSKFEEVDPSKLSVSSEIAAKFYFLDSLALRFPGPLATSDSLRFEPAPGRFSISRSLRIFRSLCSDLLGVLGIPSERDLLRPLRPFPIPPPCLVWSPISLSFGISFALRDHPLTGPGTDPTTFSVPGQWLDHLPTQEAQGLRAFHDT